MAIAFDSTSTSIHTGSQSSPTYTWTHTVTGTNPILIASVTYSYNSGTPSVTAFTYNGVALTLLTRVTKINNGALATVANETWYLKAPPTGANTASLTITGTIFSPKVGASSFTGVDQTSPVDVATTSTGAGSGAATAVLSITTATANALVFWGFSWENMPNTQTQTQTSLYNDNSGGDVIGASSYQISITVGAYSNTYTATNSSATINAYASNIASFKPFIAPPPAPAISPPPPAKLKTLNPANAAFATGLIVDKICGVLQGSFATGSYNNILGGILYQKLIPHGLPRPAFAEGLFSFDGITYTTTTGTFPDVNLYCDATNISVLYDSVVKPTIYYKIVLTWIDNYDTTNPLVTPILQTDPGYYFDSRQNYQKRLASGVQTVAGVLGGDTILTINHNLGYLPNAKVFFESVPGQIWPAINGGSQDLWVYDSTTQYEITPSLTTTTLSVDVFAPASAPATTNIYYRLYLDA